MITHRIIVMHKKYDFKFWVVVHVVMMFAVLLGPNKSMVRQEKSEWKKKPGGPLEAVFEGSDQPRSLFLLSPFHKPNIRTTNIHDNEQSSSAFILWGADFPWGGGTIMYVVQWKWTSVII